MASRSARSVGDGGPLYFAAIAIVNLMNFGFHALYSRALGPSLYGGLGSLLSFVVVISVPLTALQVACARAQATASADAALGPVFAKAAALGALVVAAVVAATPLLRGYLRLSSPGPLLALAGYLGISVLSCVPQGVLVGQRRFRALAIAVVAGSGLARLLFGGLFASADLGVTGALAATALGPAVTLALAIAMVRNRFRWSGSEVLRIGAGQGLLSSGAVLGLALLDSIDPLLARHAMSDTDASYYVAAATAGRIALFAPSAVALIVFPRFAVALSEGTYRPVVLLRPLAVVTLMGALVYLVEAAAPRALIRVFYGEGYAHAAPLLGRLALAGAALGCLTVLSYFHTARGSGLAFLPWGGAAAIAVFASVRHPGPGALATVVLATELTTLAASLMPALRVRTAGNAGRSQCP